MIMSNFIDEAERHAEIYNAFSPRQRSILNVVEDPTSVGGEELHAQMSLRAIDVSQAEIHWLERTGRFLPQWG